MSMAENRMRGNLAINTDTVAIPRTFYTNEWTTEKQEVCPRTINGRMHAFHAMFVPRNRLCIRNNTCNQKSFLRDSRRNTTYIICIDCTMYVLQRTWPKIICSIFARPHNPHFNSWPIYWALSSSSPSLLLRSCVQPVWHYSYYTQHVGLVCAEHFNTAYYLSSCV